MLPRTCIILLLVSLLTAAASVVGRTTSVSGVKRALAARAEGSVAGQRSPAAGRRPPGKAQGQATQARRPGRKPARRRPQPPPGQQQQAAGPTYLVCYLYPDPAAYQGVQPGQPFAAANNAPPLYLSYRASQPPNTGSRAPDGSLNKSYWPQVGYPTPPYPIRLVCPIYQPVNANAVVSPQQVSESSDNNPDNMLVADDPNIPVVDVDPGTFNLPDNVDFQLPYDSVYEPSRLDPEITYPAGGYVTPQAFDYPPPFPIPVNL